MFNLARFRRLAAAQWAEHRKAYGWFIGIGIMVHFVLLLVSWAAGNRLLGLSTQGQAGLYFTGLYLTGTIFAARYFQSMSRTESALVTLMRPASSLEKWLLALAFVAVLYPIAYTLAYYVCNWPASIVAAQAAVDQLAQKRVDLLAAGTDPLLAEKMYPHLLPEKYRLFHIWETLTGWQSWLAVVLSLAVFQAFAMLGSLYFRTMPFIKTILAGFLLLLASILLVAVADSRPDGLLGYWEARQEITGWQAVYFPLAWFLVPGLLWLACLFALREREIA